MREIPQNTVITGSIGLLAGHLAFSYLMDSKTVLCPVNNLQFNRFSEFLQRLKADINSSANGEVNENNIRNLVKHAEWSEISGDTEIWFFANPINNATNESELSEILKEAHRLNVTAFNYVVTPYSGGGNWHWITNPNDFLDSHIPLTLPEIPAARLFITSLTVSETTFDDASYEGFLFFLNNLFDLKTEIEERFPEYFDYRSLRCFAPENSKVNLISAQKAAEMMRAIVANGTTGSFIIASPAESSFVEVLEEVGLAYEMSLFETEDAESLNAIDRLFDTRLCGFHKHLISQPVNEIEKSCKIAGVTPESLIIDEEQKERLFQIIRKNQEKERDFLLERVANFSDNFISKEINQKDHPLSYYSTGEGEKTIVLINALGQGSHYWLRLVEKLRKRYKVLFWDLRGVLGPPGNFGITDHCADLEAIIENEKVDDYHIVAWCTGPKIAVEHFLRNPQAVRSMVFLNTTIKSFESQAELNTAYETNFEPLCRILVERPAMAGSIMNSLTKSVGSEIDLFEESDEEDISLSVLEIMNRDLPKHVNRPLSAPDVLINYSGQVLDFWKYDFREKAAGVFVPVLFICTEHDQVAKPQASEFCAPLFPNAKLLRIQGATHYFLYDRPETTAGIIETFFDNSAENEIWTGVIK